jgi:hypothetical protein
MKALSHRDLARGLLTIASEFFNMFEGRSVFEEMKKCHRKERD